MPWPRYRPDLRAALAAPLEWAGPLTRGGVRANRRCVLHLEGQLEVAHAVTGASGLLAEACQLLVDVHKVPVVRGQRLGSELKDLERLLTIAELADDAGGDRIAPPGTGRMGAVEARDDTERDAGRFLTLPERGQCARFLEQEHASVESIARRHDRVDAVGHELEGRLCVAAVVFDVSQQQEGARSEDGVLGRLERRVRHPRVVRGEVRPAL